MVKRCSATGFIAQLNFGASPGPEKVIEMQHEQAVQEPPPQDEEQAETLEEGSPTRAKRAWSTRAFKALGWLGAMGLAGGLSGAIEGLFAGKRAGLPELGGAELNATMALGVLLLGLLGTLIGLVIGPVRGAMPEDFWRRLWRFMRRPRGMVIGAGLVLLFGVAFFWRQHTKPIEWAAIDWRALLALLAGAGLFVGLRLAARWRRWVSPASVCLLVVLLVGSSTSWSSDQEAGGEALLRIGSETLIGGRVLLKARTFFDADGDGFPTTLCHADCDCNDSSGAIRPGAMDIAGNGIDEDCDGRDLSLEERDRFDHILNKAEASASDAEVATPVENKATPEQAPEPTAPPQFPLHHRRCNARRSLGI